MEEELSLNPKDPCTFKLIRLEKYFMGTREFHRQMENYSGGPLPNPQVFVPQTVDYLIQEGILKGDREEFIYEYLKTDTLEYSWIDEYHHCQVCKPTSGIFVGELQRFDVVINDWPEVHPVNIMIGRDSIEVYCRYFSLSQDLEYKLYDIMGFPKGVGGPVTPY